MRSKAARCAEARKKAEEDKRQLKAAAEQKARDAAAKPKQLNEAQQQASEAEKA